MKNINTLIRNIKFLMNVNIEEEFKKSDINILEISELCAIKSKFISNSIKIPIIKDDIETIQELIATNKSYIRFGDGEFELMFGHDKNIFEPLNDDLSSKLIKIFQDPDKNILTGARYDLYRMSISCKHNKINQYKWQWFLTNYKKMEYLYNFDKIYYSAGATCPFTLYNNNYDFEKQFNLFKKIWDCKNITVITGDRVYNGIKYNIFDNAKKINYIFGPTENSYEKYNELLEKCFLVDKSQILIFALGPTGKCIAYDLSKLGYRTLDLGHIIKGYDLYCKYKNKDINEEQLNSLINIFYCKD